MRAESKPHMRLTLKNFWLLMLVPAAFGCSCVSTGGCPGLGSAKGPVFV